MKMHLTLFNSSISLPDGAGAISSCAHAIRFWTKKGYLLALLCWVNSGSLYGQSAATDVIQNLDGYTVFGSPEQVFEMPGSAAYIGTEQVQAFGYDNIDQILRRVPGAYFRTEDGFGLFPNISLRGVGSMRTSNLTVMEDGILAAPAPYAAPAAYYTPTSGRMSGFEVIKGSSQVRFGPQITGGAINYLSTPIPAANSGFLKVLYGTENEWRGHLWFGGESAFGSGKIGYLAELYARQSDGFKTIDATAATPASSSTGFHLIEPMLKLFWEPDAAGRHRFDLKFGFSDRDADETYLGLTSQDFRQNPYRRYAASRFDHIDTEHLRMHLRYSLRINPETRWFTTIYTNDFERAWYKINDVNAGQGNRNLSQVLAQPESMELAVLRGEAPGSFRVRNNNRSYLAQGIQSFVQHSRQTALGHHDLEFGFRWHKDYEDRFQNEDTYSQDATGAINGLSRGAPGSQDNRRGIAEAVALSFSDKITNGSWTITPGIRYENIHYENQDRRPGRSSSVGSLDVWAYGTGFLYKITPASTLFANAFRGFATPGPSAVTSGNLSEETSDAFELGYRIRPASGAFQMEVVLFHSDFQDLIVPDNIGGAGSGNGTTENIGEARVRGLEASLKLDPAQRFQWDFRLPLYLAYTYTEARLRNDVNAGGGGGGSVESIFAGGRRNARLPYVPEHQISLGAAYQNGPMALHLDAFYVASTYGTASNVANEERPDGTPDARFGRSDAYFLLDLSFHYDISARLRLTLGANNLLDRAYLASRLPHGPRPGQPRFIHAGLEYRF